MAMMPAITNVNITLSKKTAIIQGFVGAARIRYVAVHVIRIKKMWKNLIALNTSSSFLP